MTVNAAGPLQREKPEGSTLLAPLFGLVGQAGYQEITDAPMVSHHPGWRKLLFGRVDNDRPVGLLMLRNHTFHSPHDLAIDGSPFHLRKFAGLFVHIAREAHSVVRGWAECWNIHSNLSLVDLTTCCNYDIVPVSRYDITGGYASQSSSYNTYLHTTSSADCGSQHLRVVGDN
jgi:hypothetical protein